MFVANSGMLPVDTISFQECIVVWDVSFRDVVKLQCGVIGPVTVCALGLAAVVVGHYLQIYAIKIISTLSEINKQ